MLEMPIWSKTEHSGGISSAPAMTCLARIALALDGSKQTHTSPDTVLRNSW